MFNRSNWFNRMLNRVMRNRSGLLLILIIAISALGTAPLAQRVYSAGNEPAPQVIDSAPARGEEMPVDANVTLYFDQAMEHQSVERAFRATPAVTGTFSWPDDATAVFKPNAPLTRNTEFTFSVSSEAKSKSGVPLKDTYTLKLKTPGALTVTQIIPGNRAVNVEAKPTITVIFNRPVVPLLPVEEMGKLPSPITITPAVEGKGEWLNTTIYTFKPTQLAGGSQYTVKVNKGLTDVTGSVLANDVTAIFSTVSPRIIDVFPVSNRTRILLEPAIEIVFSQPMDKAATEKSFSLRNTGANAGLIAGEFKWNESADKLTYKPSTRLDYTTDYQIRVDKTIARSTTGGILEQGVTSTFRTINLPEIIRTNPGDGEVAHPYGGFSLTFSAPMNLDDFKKRVTIEPKPELLYDDYVDDRGFHYNIGFGTEPSTDYTITVDTNGLVDIYGTPLKVDSTSPIYKVVAPGKIQIKYSTQAYRPEASLKTGSYIGLYSAYRQLTRVFSTHRNIDSLELALYGLPATDFMKLASSEAYDFQRGYQPSNFLRRWTVPVANDLNVLRYDLLTISTQGPNLGQRENVTCVGAPPSRITPNSTIVVLRDDPTPQRVRQRAGIKAKVVGQLNAGVQLNVIGGPICADKFVWWRVSTLDSSLTGWTAEGDQTHYFIGAEGATSTVPTKPTVQPTQDQASANAKAEALEPGAYWLEFSSPELGGDRPLRHLMVVSTANITMKVTDRELLAWVTDLQSGKPVANVDVKFSVRSSLDGLGTAKTDANGLARLTMKDKLDTLYTDVFTLIEDGTNFGIGISNWSDGIEPWSFEQDGNFYPQNLSVYMYTERALYRPGQPVYFRGVVRSKDDVTYSMPAGKTVEVDVRDGEGKSVYTKKLEITPYGTFADSFDLDPNAALGYYQIVARPVVNTEDSDNIREFSASFNVAEYRLPEFQVKTAADKSEVLQGEKIRVAVDSTYFFGGAVSDAKIAWSVFANDYYFDYKGSGGYSFIDYNEDAGYSESETPYGNSVADGESKTDAQGKFIIEIPADLGKTPRSQSFTIEAVVTDESDQQVAGRVDVTVHQGEFYIGVKPQEYVGTAQKSQKIDVLSVGWDSKPMPGADISMKVVERVWSSVETVEPGTGRTVWNYEVKENPVTEGVVHTDQDGKAVYEFTPKKGGIYKVYATSRDAKGNQITSSTFAWVAGPNYVPWRQQNSNRIDLKIDRDNYNVGDTASILIASPFQGEATALITVERGHILQTQVVTMPNNSYVYKLPITPDMAPNAYVSVMVVKGVDEKNPTAAFRMGLIQLGVQTDRLKLNIEVKSDKPQAGPREKVTYTLHVTDYKGDPVQAEVGVALVDQAALSLLPDQSMPILQHFYGKQGLAVRTASSLVISVDQQTQQIINTVKGGGGGGPEGGIFEVRQEFVTTPLWSPTVTTDASGNATVEVTLPDNLTTWRLDARAVTNPTGELQTTLVGQTTTDLISTKPLLIRPVTPRFYVIGDQSVLAAVVNNNTDQPQDITVKIETTGVEVKGDATLKGTIPAKGRSRFEWPVEVQDVNAVGVTFFASSADNKYTDAAKSAVGQGDDKTLPVMRYEAPETVGTAGMITNEGGTNTEGVVLPKRFNITQGTLDIRIDPSLAATTVDALEVLRNYPYQCLEQTVSRFLPNLMTYRAFKQLGVEDQKMTDELTNVINYAVQRLYAEQHVDGGWGWFVRDVSNPLVTAYAVIGLSEASKQGFPVDKNVLARAVAFVQKHVKDIGQQPETWQLNRQAFLLYAIARGNAGNVSQSVRLFNVREKMSIYARAYLAMTFNILTPNDKRYSDVLLVDISSRAVASATGMHWEEDYADYWNWNTDTRTTAIVLNALVELQPENALIPNVVRWLMIARKADSWETTQETAWAIMGLTDWMAHTGELKPDYTFSVGMNDTTLKTDEKVTTENVKQSTKLRIEVKDLLTAQVNKLIISRSAGNGALYYTAHLTAYLPVEQIKPLSRGISITRTYSLNSDRSRKPITEAKVGDIIRVSLTIVAPNDLNYVVINDPIPAGTESINPELTTTASVGTPPELKLDDPLSRGWGWWWFSNTEMRDEKTVLYATYLPAGTYQFTYSLRAGLAGQYHVIPTTGQEFYFPEVYGRSDGMLFNILPGEGQ